MGELTKADIQVGKTYRAKRPLRANNGQYNDREIIYVGPRTVQYDGITVKLGQRYPSVSIEKFLAWASHEISEEE